MQNLVKFRQFPIKILSGNEILTSTKGHNSIRNLRKLTRNKPNLSFDTFILNLPNIQGLKTLSLGLRNHWLHTELKVWCITKKKKLKRSNIFSFAKYEKTRKGVGV